MLRVALLIVVNMTLVCCKNEATKISNVDIDSVAKEHINIFDSVPYMDTNHLSFKVLKHYLAKDTAYFSYLSQEMKNNNETKRLEALSDSCIHHKELWELNCDEVYRLRYQFAFCPYTEIITIRKTKNVLAIDYILFNSRDVFIGDTQTCKIIEVFTKPLAINDWEKFKSSLNYADYWGMQQSNGVHGFEGSTYEIKGYIKGDTSFGSPRNTHSVSRWIGRPTAFSDLGMFMIELAEGHGCVRITKSNKQKP